MTSRITLTPTSALEADLPTTVTVSAENDVFVPPYATGSELFGKPAKPPTLIGNYSLSANPNTGSQAFVGSTSDTYINADSININPVPTQSLGVSFWFKNTSNVGGSNGNHDTFFGLALQGAGTDSTTHKQALRILRRTNTTGLVVEFEGDRIGQSGVHTKKAQWDTMADAIWYHVFTYIVNPSSSSSYARLFVNGVESQVGGGRTYNTGDFEYQTSGTDSLMRISKDPLVGGTSPFTDTSCGITISDVYVSTNPDFGNHLNAYYTNTSIPTSSHDVLIPIVPDVYPPLNGDYSLSTNPNTGSRAFVGKASAIDGGVNVNTAGTYINADSININPVPTQSLGVSFWYKTNNGGLGDYDTLFNLELRNPSTGAIKSALNIRQRTYLLPGSIQVDFNYPVPSGSKKAGTAAIALDVWHHLFAYIVNPNSSSSYAHLFIDGVEYTAQSHNYANFEFEGTVSRMRIGKNRQADTTDSTSNITTSDIYVSTNPDFGNHLNAYYTNTNIPTASYDALIPIQDGHDIDNVSDVYWSKAEVPVSSATGLKNALQGQGIIGDSFIGINTGQSNSNLSTSAYLDLGSKIPNLSSNFLGVSFWYKPHKHNHGYESILQLYSSNNELAGGAIPFEITRWATGGVFMLDNVSPNPNNNDIQQLHAKNDTLSSVWTDSSVSLQKNLNEWIHIYAWVDGDNATVNLDVNGVPANYTYIAQTGVSAQLSVSAIDSFKVGYAYNPYNNKPRPYGLTSYISNLYWSTDREFKNARSTYLNQEPTKRLFERSNFTTREMFTQDRNRQGNDVPLSDWNNAIMQIDGIVGKGAEPISATPVGTSGMAYIDLSERNPIFKKPELTNDPNFANFLGVSCFFKVNDVSIISQPLLGMNAGLSSPISGGNYGIDVTTWPAGGPFSSPYILVRVGNGIAPPNYIQHLTYSNQTAIVEGQWHHLFFYYELLDTESNGLSPDPLHMFIDGVEQSSSFDTSTSASFNLNYIEKIYTHGMFYNPAWNGPGIGNSTISINNLYMSSDQNFKYKLDEYAKLPTVEVT